MATTQLFYIKIKEGEEKFNLFATKVDVTSSTWKIFPRVKNSGSTHFPFCTQGIILFSRVFFFSSLFFPFVSFSLLLLNASTLCLEVCTRVPVCISKQLTIISSLLSTEIIRIELNPPGLKARAFYPLSCLTSLRSPEGSYSLLTWYTIDDVSFYFAVFKWSHFQLFDLDMPKCLLSFNMPQDSWIFLLLLLLQISLASLLFMFSLLFHLGSW